MSTAEKEPKKPFDLIYSNECQFHIKMKQNTVKNAIKPTKVNKIERIRKRVKVNRSLSTNQFHMNRFQWNVEIKE